MEYILIIILGAAVVFAVMKVKKQRQQKSRQKMLSDELARLKQMNVDLDVEGYIREEKRAMAYPENREILTTMQMNLVAAYINNAQAEEAVSCLKQMEPSVLPLDFQILYHHNMLFAKWMQDEHAFGEQLAESWPLLEKHVDEAQWKPILKIIQVLNDLYTKNYDAAQQHIRQLSAPNSNHAASLQDMLWAEINIQTGQKGKALALLDKMSQRQNFPVITAWIKQKRIELKNKGVKGEETKNEVSE
ncbi:hypothetical protein [Dielma fastidiosa]|uniref:hypothetical protein n=1 Tax=Dielma fastidiosa TaxID=1034346 RepID=UPI00356B155E